MEHIYQATENLSHCVQGQAPPPNTSVREPDGPRVDILEDDRCFLQHGILSEDECKYFIMKSEEVGFSQVTYEKAYRNNERCVIFSPETSEWMWQRIRKLIKPIVITPHDYKQVGEGHKLEGRWVPVGLNPCWRICKYFPGGHFAPHFDGPFIVSSEKRSLKTFNLYLNGDFEGGTTNFVNEKQSLYRDDETGKFKAQEQNIERRIVPKTGMALIFNHHIFHEGEALKSGLKYIMRSDILFCREVPPEIPENETKALDLIRIAEVLEREGEYMEAVKYYRQAYKLCPELDGK
eukprot:TRINITY_DN2127_c0_g1_i5.p1 TRINITY_DN2127_c0_g1~~TRINITY_DN2127_c0_g1_i5.p1  ORF type:complete len:292 (+),score=49.01 TRINITY_DN2127_c0_g1_i5:62-937(+)